MRKKEKGENEGEVGAGGQEHIDSYDGAGTCNSAKLTTYYSLPIGLPDVAGISQGLAASG